MEAKLGKGSAKLFEVEHLLGRVPDALIAHITGRSNIYIAKRRIERFIPPYHEEFNEAILSLSIEERLGVYIDQLSIIRGKFEEMRNIDIYTQYRVPVAAISAARDKWRIAEPEMPYQRRVLTELVKTLPDSGMAEATGISQEELAAVTMELISGSVDLKELDKEIYKLPETVAHDPMELLGIESITAQMGQKIGVALTRDVLTVWDRRWLCAACIDADPAKASENSQADAGKSLKVAVKALVPFLIIHSGGLL